MSGNGGPRNQNLRLKKRQRRASLWRLNGGVISENGGPRNQNLRLKKRQQRAALWRLNGGAVSQKELNRTPHSEMVLSRSPSNHTHNEDSVKRDRHKSASAERRTRSRSPRRSRSGSRRRRSSSPRRSRSRGRRYSPRSQSRSRSSSPDGYRLHIGDLDEECRKADLERVFMKYGPLKEIWLASYAPFYAFVVFRNRLDAQDACTGADGSRIAGRRVRVSHALPRNKGPRNRFVADRYRGDRDRRY